MNKQKTINNQQRQTNDEQGLTNDNQTIINDKTRLDLKFNNLVPIFVSLFSMTFAIIMFVYKPQMENQAKLDLLNQKVETLVRSQKDMTDEFRQWKTQAETRLGTVESRQNTVISYLENHLQVQIK